MQIVSTSEHWQRIYTRRPTTEVGWYEPDPAISRRLVRMAIEDGATSAIDVGGGASYLVDHLLDDGLERLAVLDISEAALGITRERLGARAAQVDWLVGDVTTAADVGLFDVWHDRAVFHFLLDPEDRRRYVALAERSVTPGGSIIIATFSHDGPDTCSGLPVQRWEPDELTGELGPGWQLLRSDRHTHTTPSGKDQAYVYCRFRRQPG